MEANFKQPANWNETWCLKHPFLGKWRISGNRIWIDTWWFRNVTGLYTFKRLPEIVGFELDFIEGKNPCQQIKYTKVAFVQMDTRQRHRKSLYRFLGLQSLLRPVKEALFIQSGLEAKQKNGAVAAAWAVLGTGFWKKTPAIQKHLEWKYLGRNPTHMCSQM